MVTKLGTNSFRVSW